jgi:delta(3,5)-delta(2,4)-dienoyl-CoA isomerase
MDQLFFREMKQCFDTIAEDPRVRVVVLSANGRAFSAGLDLKGSSLSQNDNAGKDVARRAFALRKTINVGLDAADSLELCGKPVIAVVHSHCIGGGVDFICAADIRYAAADASFCIKEVDIGIAADVGTLARFPKIVGNDSITRELAYTARTFGAAEAKEIGLLGRVFPSKEAAMESALATAALIASKSPVGVFGTKNVLVGFEGAVDGCDS